MRTTAVFVLAGLLAGAPVALAEDFSVPVDDTICAGYEPLGERKPAAPLVQRVFRYTQLALKHRVEGLASYYSSFFDGRKTANGETFRNGKYSAAHLTLPLGTWIEVKSRATGRKLRLRVNDRGPYVKKFCLDLSQAAARYLGVDTARDRHVEFRIIALPGEEPLPEEALTLAGDVEAERAALAQH
ncbi:MAG TPA: septal ring lytic transglycosylase RlpA family protein [Thermoanaerobaculia bacterium]|nr:septal ring lytic transglycosylase RlpA family protein [Thermoanaerobaculia bacterium]